MRPARLRFAHSRRALPLLVLWPALLNVGCTTTARVPTSADRAIARLARPILTLDPDAAWTDSFNALVDQGPAAIDYLMRQPALTRRAAPDDLSVLLHTSLVHLLAHPARAPELSAACFETTLDLMHFEIKVAGQPLGREVLAARTPPWSWTDLFPASFRHDLAARVDLERDRQQLCAWWRANRHDPDIATTRRLQPQPQHLWRILARRYADGWLFEPEPGVVLCSAGPPRAPVLLQVTTYEYNLVRAACIWLGSRAREDVQARLVEFVGSPWPIVAYNARFALRYSPDPHVRTMIHRFDAAADRPPDGS